MAKKPRILKRLFQLFALLIAAMISVVVARYFDYVSHQFADIFTRGPLIVEEDFESGNLSRWSQEDLCCEHSLQFVSSPARAGTQSAEFNWTDADLPFTKDKARAELKRYGLFGLETERWYAFSIFLPEDYEASTGSNIVVQWHEIPDIHLGEGWRQPPLGLNTRDNRWVVITRWDPDRVNKQVSERGGTERIDLGDYERGKWTDWVFHVKWSADDSGILDIWKDDELVVNRRGPNTYRDYIAPYFKAGIYQQKRTGWEERGEGYPVDSRRLYFDEIRIGNEVATYEDVAPSSYADS